MLCCAGLRRAGRVQVGLLALKSLKGDDQQEFQCPVGERLARSTTLLPVATMMSLRDRLHIKTGVCMRWSYLLVFGLGGRRADGCASCICFASLACGDS